MIGICSKYIDLIDKSRCDFREALPEAPGLKSGFLGLEIAFSRPPLEVKHLHPERSAQRENARPSEPQAELEATTPSLAIAFANAVKVGRNGECRVLTLRKHEGRNPEVGGRARRRLAIHSALQAAAECLKRELQRAAAG